MYMYRIYFLGYFSSIASKCGHRLLTDVGIIIDYQYTHLLTVISEPSLVVTALQGLTMNNIFQGVATECFLVLLS